MSRPSFPFPALVGLDTLKLALQLAAVDQRLSVLVRGDKGAGKSTAARSLIGLLAPGAPFVTLPIGATDDRLLGGLDVERALKGEPALKPGLLSQAHGGVLYIDEVNLLADHLADALLDASASGIHVLEREGFSAVQDAQFVMVGSMNPEEGTLRPQLLDRFAFAVDVTAPLEPRIRSEAVARRLEYERDPDACAETWRSELTHLAARVAAARASLEDVECSRAILELVAERVAASAIRSLRSDLAVVHGSRALAALEQCPTVLPEHVETVLPLALAHREGQRPPAQRPSPPPRSDPPDDPKKEGQADAVDERVFLPSEVAAPRLVLSRTPRTAGRSADSEVRRIGPQIATRRTSDPEEVDVRATLAHAALHARNERPTGDDLHERQRAGHSGTRFVFVVDSSGSHAAHERMRAVKGAVGALFEQVYGRGDEVALISCRGGQAEVLLEPTHVPTEVLRALEYLPTGGRTPLAHALHLAAGFVTDNALVVVLTDGRANVPLHTDDPWLDALTVAHAVACPCLIVDSENADGATGRPKALADAMGASCIRLDEFSTTPLLHLKSSKHGR